jgi:hypothetical protein
MSLQGSHRCIERNTECDCPICGDYLFTSPETVVFMPCGHSIHQRCYNQHIKSYLRFHITADPYTDRTDAQHAHGHLLTWIITFDYSTSKSADNQCPRRMIPGKRSYYGMRLFLIADDSNDCSAKSRVSFHFVGHKCNLYRYLQVSLTK